MTILRALLVLLMCSASIASAQEPAEEAPSAVTSAIASGDALFGTWVVGPLAKVLFWDAVFWDNTLAPGEGVGTRVPGADGTEEEVTGWTAEEGYVYRRRIDIDRPVVALTEPLPRRMGDLQVTLRTGTRASADGSHETPILMAHIDEQPVDLHALGLEPIVLAEGEVADPDAVQRAVNGLAPFAVRVDLSTGLVVPADVVLPSHHVKADVGMTVAITPHETGEVVEARPNGSALVLSHAERTDPAPLPNPTGAAMPIIVLWLVLGALFFTVRMSFVNLRAFGHAIVVTMGRYDNPDDDGEISHFQALSSALSATVGLGNIAGVAIAVTTGGPGAIFWMVIAGFLGMSSKFVECTLGQMYRVIGPDGTVSGGPMHYLDRGLAEIGLAGPGKVLAVLFAVLCIGGSLGGGNMFQANQSFAAVAYVVPWFGTSDWGSSVYGVILAVTVGLVIIGGIKRIGAAASLIVPLMCTVYVAAGVFIILANASEVPAAVGAIVGQAFTPEAGFGGMLGVLATGFKRASFSSEAGVGSASIAHSAASTPYPVREGIVSLLEPFIDTVVVCSTTGLVVVITGAYQIEGVGDGVVLTQQAFGSVISWFPYVLSFAVMLFAFSTMISWSYYGERCTMWLFGPSARMPYRVVFLLAVYFGSVFKLGNILDFSDMMILAMAFPNILGAVLLSGKVKTAFDEYWAKLKAGEFARA